MRPAVLLACATACCTSPGSAAGKDPAPTVQAKPAPDAAGEPAAKAWTLALQPLGDVDREALDTVAQTIEGAFGWSVVEMAPAEHPAAAWYKPRKRWRAEIILEWLAPRMPATADRIMALTRKDISTTKGSILDWGICGLADMGGPASVVSTYRIKKKMGKLGPAERKQKYLKRLRDLSAHEFGHTLGLPHCPTKGCIMEDAMGTVLTFDGSSGKLCDACVAKLAKAGFTLP